MKLLTTILVLGPVVFVTGCASVVNSVKETQPPENGTELSGMRYYLPKGKVSVAGAWNNNSKTWDMKIAPAIEADTANRYVLSRHKNALFDDDVTISVDPATGFLTAVNTTTTDQTVNALGSLVSAAASALTFGAGLGPIPKGLLAEDALFKSITNNAVFSSFQVFLDPNDSKGLSGMCDVVSGDGNLYARFTFSCVRPDTAPKEDYTPPATPNPTSFDGVVTRRLIPFALKVDAVIYSKDGARHAKATFADQIVMLPDANRVYYVEASRTPLVSNTTKISFANGVVSNLQRVRPSIVMGIVGVPQNLLKALAPIPLQIRTDQLNLVSTEAKTLQAESDIKKLESAK